MKIVSTTITNARADVIGKALAAIAPHVDECLVIYTGSDSGEETWDAAACGVQSAGGRMTWLRWDWCNDFAAARNNALALARGFGADWAITADTDEIYQLPAPPAMRDFLAACTADVVQIPHASRMFSHPRCIRVNGPTLPRWIEPVHEYLSGVSSQVHAPAGWAWATQERPQEDLLVKYTAYAKILEKRTREQPNNPRAWFYLGDCYSILKMNASALSAWDRRMKLQKTHPGNVWEAGWTAWRAAGLRLQLQKPIEALATAQRGLQLCPAMGELAWLSGWIYYQLADFPRALEWAEKALEMPIVDRGGMFSYPPALRTYPEDLKRWAEKALTRPNARQDVTENSQQ